MDAVERAFGQHVAHDFDGIVLADAQVGQAAFGDLLAQRADARHMHFDAKVIVVAVGIGDLRRGFAHAETDFEDFRGISAVDRSKVDRLPRIGHADLRHQLGVVARLRFRHAAGAADVALDVAMALAAFGVDALAHEPISPLVGDDGSAE